MNPVLHAAKLGVLRGWIEFKQMLKNPQEFGFNIIMTIVFLVVLYFQRNKTIEGNDMALAMFALPSLLGMLVVFGGFMGAATTLTFEREDGTLLRAKATPNGMVSYLISRIISVTTFSMVSVIMLLMPGLFLIKGLADTSWSGWLLLLLIFIIGILATLPWGAVVGSLVKSTASSFNLTMLPLGALTAISGIFYPITSLPDWLQVIGQIFPVYWLGLGMRAALLPETAVLAEIGESWRYFEMFGVLGIWTIAGFLIVPKILRRMARKESGSTMEKRKQEMMSRGY
ncbi:ABC-2 type transport system permease protein [Gracilibacillus orientalis]|uniref:Transport permease protein n=1 Tax=Gracilibacillus orientalis TaxID=334253 RepID=A0A1I4LJN9_9BACI|nr:ABC transporter permease [Gracilibacillus orientalis]SFL91013.1 ABC-2 type transport system permease protein [Gracilibacillus orientalis]